MLSTPLTVPKGLAYVWWTSGLDDFSELQIDFTVHNDIRLSPGLFMQMYQGRIGDVGMYFGFQTDVNRPGFWRSGQGSDLQPVGHARCR